MIVNRQIFESNNLELSFQRLKFSSRHLHKNIYIEALRDIEPFREDYFEYLDEKFLYTNSVDGHHVVRAYMPKKGGFVRPITYIGFEALLIYQAIANKLADSFYPTLSLNYNKITFGNHFNDNASSPFVFMPWKKRWKNYQEKSKNLIEVQGFNYVVDFDIASFYDSIDHKLLISALDNYLDESSTELLLSILELSHSDFKHIKPGSGSSIPQGPLASTVLAEIFLHSYIDTYFIKRMQSNDISYIRYADDIRVFSQQKSVAKKFITILDLLCRNSGLIPQSSKVGVTFYQNSSEFTDQDLNKFSQIQAYYKTTGKLKARDSRKAINLIKEMLRSGEIDKTKLGFYLYKIEKDDEVKDLIISSIIERYEFCDSMLFYLKKHYHDCQIVLGKLVELFIDDDNYFLDYPVFLFFDKFYSHLTFNPNYFFKIFHKKEAGKWLSKIAVIKWALHWNQKEILDSIVVDDIDNVLLKRELLYAQHKLSIHSIIKQQKEWKLIDSDHSDLVFKSISLYHERLMFGKVDDDNSFATTNLNPIIGKILNGKTHNTVVDTLRCNSIITKNLDNLFSKDVFDDENEYEQLSILCSCSTKFYQDKTYKLFIDSLDQFNHILIERLYFIKYGKRSSEKYGAILQNARFISDEMLGGVKETFFNIHQLRNGELHPKDIKTGQFHSSNKHFQQKVGAMNQIYSEWLRAIEEILSWYNRKYIHVLTTYA